MQNNTKYIFKKTFLKIICLIVWETDKKRVAIALEWLCYVQPITVRGDYIIRRTICDSTYAISTLQDAKHRSLWTDECAVASGSIRPYLCIEWSKKPGTVWYLLFSRFCLLVLVEVSVALRCDAASLDGRWPTFRDSMVLSSWRVIIPLVKLRCSGTRRLVVYYTRVGTLIVATIYLQLIQNRYMFRSFTVLHCSHQHCVQPVASDVEVVGYL